MAMAGTIRSFPKEKAIVSGEMAVNMYRTGPYFIAKALSEIPLLGVSSFVMHFTLKWLKSLMLNLIFTTHCCLKIRQLLNALFGAIIYPLTNLRKGRFKYFLGLTSLHSIASEAVGLLIGSIAPNSDVALALFPPIIVLNIIFDGKNISEENTPWFLKWVAKFGLVKWGFTGLALNEFEGLEFKSSGPFRGPVTKTGEQALARFGMDGISLDSVVSAQLKIIVCCWILSFMGLSLTRQKFVVMLNHPK